MSVAMLVTTVVPTGKVLPLGGTLTTPPARPQLSVGSVTVKVTLLRLHWPGSATRFILVGQTSTGGSVSRTVTVKVHRLCRPWMSVAMLVTVGVPTRTVLPLGGTLTTGPAKPQLSVGGVTVKVTLLRLHWPASATRFIFVGETCHGGPG